MSAHIIAFRGITPAIDPDCFIAPGATIIGDVTIGAGSSVWFGCVLRGDVNSIRIGRNTNIQDGTVLHVGDDPPRSVVIGDNVLIGHMAMIHGCTIEDGAFIGMQAMILDGAVVEAGALLAAGSLVAPGKRITAGQLWAGRPARPIRPLTDRDRDMQARGAPHYVDLAREYRAHG
ncbi:MAG: gamma carbonic anhydrase family protein [Devosia nanyangense]|uniref:Gamma carbonic anhydrase family protein n=1 Tax=Devosia nanyangense TaxID=1228055 RepID=A0A933NYL6_9HYPH|nr:gamma carbonic anhydrase family protein [Devosia nanyangense]